MAFYFSYKVADHPVQSARVECVGAGAAYGGDNVMVLVEKMQCVPVMHWPLCGNAQLAGRTWSLLRTKGLRGLKVLGGGSPEDSW